MKLYLLVWTLLVVGQFSTNNSVKVRDSTTTVVAGDSIPPVYRNGLLYSPPSDGVSIAAFMVGILGFGCLLSGVFIPFFVLVTASVALGVVGLARIRKSSGQRGGRLLAWLAIITGTFWLTMVVLAARILRLP